MSIRHGVRYPVVELRQYTLHAGQRDVLVELFDREFVETQEAAGMAVIGQFRDLEDPDRFVWLRGFPDMSGRAAALGRFYGGPVWKTHRDQANATMIDSDDVLLLRPVDDQSGFPAPTAPRPPVGHPSPPASSLVVATVWLGVRPFDSVFVEFFQQRVRPLLSETGATPLACLRTEYAENTFPALPVRSGEHAFVWFTSFDRPADLAEHQRRLAESPIWRDEVRPALSTTLVRDPQQLRLAPTARSLLR